MAGWVEGRLPDLEKDNRRKRMSSGSSPQISPRVPECRDSIFVVSQSGSGLEEAGVGGSHGMAIEFDGCELW